MNVLHPEATTNAEEHRHATRMPNAHDFAPSLLPNIKILFPTQMPNPLGMHEVNAAYKAQSLLWHPDRSPCGADPSVRTHRLEHMQQINLAKEALTEAVSAPSWSHGHKEPPPTDGQRGRHAGAAGKTYTLRVRSFGGTISGLLRGELTTRMVEDQLDAIAKAINRSINQLVVGLEVHKNPANPVHDEHIHFVVEFADRLHHTSSALATNN